MDRLHSGRLMVICSECSRGKMKDVVVWDVMGGPPLPSQYTNDLAIRAGRLFVYAELKIKQ